MKQFQQSLCAPVLRFNSSMKSSLMDADDDDGEDKEKSKYFQIHFKDHIIII